MSPTTTKAPADASAAAMDLPIPEPAPVTTATDPSIFMSHLIAHRRARKQAAILRERSHCCAAAGIYADLYDNELDEVANVLDRVIEALVIW